MSPESAIIAALLVPLAGALGILATGRIHPNLRETVTLGRCRLARASRVIW